VKRKVRKRITDDVANREETPAMMGSDFESEEFQTALGEALRAGPDSPAWKRIEEHLANSENGVDLRGALQVRKLLDGVKDRFGVVVPSAGFKDRMLAALEADSRRNAPTVQKSWTPLVIAAVAACLALGVLIGVVASMFKTGIAGFQQMTVVIPPRPAPNKIVVPVMFNSQLPAGWHSMGQLRLSVDKGMHLDRHDNKRLGAFTGAYVTSSLPANKHFDVEMVVRTIGTAGGSPEIFITDSTAYPANPSADNLHQVEFSVTNDRPTLCMADMQVVGQGDIASAKTESHYDVKFSIDGSNMTADMAGTSTFHFSGPTRLDASKPWWLGARLRVIGSHRDECAIIDSITVTPR